MKKSLLTCTLLFLVLQIFVQGQVNVSKVATGSIYQTTIRNSSYLFDHADYAVFIPEDITVIRGVLVHQHGCTMEGIGASTAYDLQYQSLAKKWGLALVGPDIYPKAGRSCADWRDPESGSGPALIKMLDEIGRLSGHNELKTAPWLLWGYSGGGYWTLAMMKEYPERILAVFSYSPAFDPQWDFPEAAAKIPLMIRHAGSNDLNSPRVDCWGTALHAFSKLRKMGGYVSIAYTPHQTHNFSYVRYMAVPFYEAALAQRLPEIHSSGLKDMDVSKAWLGDTATLQIHKAATYTGNKASMSWFSDSLVAVKWKEFVTTGSVSDMTPPPAPYGLQFRRVNSSVIEVTWKADADIESGIKHFSFFKNGRRIGDFPRLGEYQKFDTNGDNTIPLLVPELKFEIIGLDPDKNPIINIRSANHFNIESPNSADLIVPPL